MKKTALALSITTALLTACGGGGSDAPNSNNTGDTAPVRKTMFLALDNGSIGHEPWVTDGTAEGTKLLKDIMPGQLASFPRGAIDMGGETYFLAVTQNQQTSNNELALWKTNGTPEGTVVLTESLSIQDGSGPMTIFKGKLYFVADDGTGNEALYATDGTKNGTRMVQNTSFTSNGSVVNVSQFRPSQLMATKDKLFFKINYQNKSILLVTDGSDNGARQVLSASTPGGPNSVMWYAVMDDKLYFNARDSSGDRKLWVSDGTDTGTKVIKNISAGDVIDPSFIREANGKLYFTAKDANHGTEVWVSDGSSARELQDISPGTSNTKLDSVTGLNGKVYFLVTDSAGVSSLWETQGTVASTKKVMDLDANYTTHDESFRMMAVNDKLYFITKVHPANQASWEMQLWVSDGTQAGTKQINTPNIKEYRLETSPFNFLSVNAKDFNEVVIFAGTPDVGVEPYTLNTETDSVSLIKDVWVGVQSGVFGSAI